MVSEKTLCAIEFDKVLAAVAEFAVLANTKKRLLTLMPASDYADALARQQRTKEASALLNAGAGQIAFFDAFDDWVFSTARF